MDIWNKSQELFSFLGFDLSDASRKFLTDHTQKEKYKAKPEVWNTFRDTNSIKNHWRKEMKYEEVAQIQNKCQQALRLWGYRDAKDELDLLQFDPVEPLPTILKFNNHL